METELWISDGTAAGTVLVKDILAGNRSLPFPLIGSPTSTARCFSSANDGVNGEELWKSDGTASGTLLAVDINPQTGNGSPSQLIPVGDTLFFVATRWDVGSELWKWAIDLDLDGVPDTLDKFPTNPAEWFDTDNDNIGDNADLDDDGDGMTDFFEIGHFGLDPLDPSDAVLDFDGDGYTNVEEFNAGTDLLNPNSVPDADGDGIDDHADLDDDNDGIPDTFELATDNLDPLNPADAALDADNDGFSNLVEFQSGTNPNDDTSFPNFDNDVVVNLSTGVFVRLNDSVWVALHDEPAAAIATADVDNNGVDDIIASFAPGSGPDINGGTYISRNGGPLSALSDFTAEIITVGNFDGIGGDDLFLDFGVDGLWTSLNDSVPNLLVALSPVAMAAGDVDKSGQDDVVVSINGFGTLVFKNLSVLEFLDASVAQTLATADVDGDGADDVIAGFAPGTGPGGTGGLFIARNQGPLSMLTSLPIAGMAVGDFDGSGEDDLFVDLGSPVGVWAYMNDATVIFFAPFSLEAMAAGDIDNSGQDDLILSVAGFGTFVFKDMNTLEILHASPALDLATGNVDGN